MRFVYRGWGWVTLFLLVGCMYVLPGAWRLLHGESSMAALKAVQYDIPFAASLVIAGLLLSGLGLYLNRNPDRPVVERTTGRTIRAGAQHTMYHLRMEYWGYAALAGGLVMLLQLMRAHHG